MPSQVHVRVELCDIMTAPMCAQLVIEFLKYIVYQRQQIPYPYKQLMSVLTKKESINAKDAEKVDGEHCVAVPSWRSVQVENEYRKVSGVFETMETTFKHLEEELNTCNGMIEEVAIILGATPLSPRDVYRLRFPPYLPGHVASQHPPQSNMLQLLRSIISSSELHSLVSQPLAPTNLYLLLRRQGGTGVTQGFTQKTRYILPSTGKHAIIQFTAPSSPVHECVCLGINIFQDSPQPSCETVPSEPSEELDCVQWFQARTTVKGFKDLKINGVSVTSIWLQPR